MKCKWLANKWEKVREVGSPINNSGLDVYGTAAEENEMILLASIFGGTSTY
jgi:hypothetical protein